MFKPVQKASVFARFASYAELNKKGPESISGLSPISESDFLALTFSLLVVFQEEEVVVMVVVVVVSRSSRP
jgi:hypothetical protein